MIEERRFLSRLHQPGFHIPNSWKWSSLVTKLQLLTTLLLIWISTYSTTQEVHLFLSTMLAAISANISTVLSPSKTWARIKRTTGITRPKLVESSMTSLLADISREQKSDFAISPLIETQTRLELARLLNSEASTTPKRT